MPVLKCQFQIINSVQDSLSPDFPLHLIVGGTDGIWRLALGKRWVVDPPGTVPIEHVCRISLGEIAESVNV